MSATPQIDWLEAGATVAPVIALRADFRVLNYFAMGAEAI